MKTGGWIKGKDKSKYKDGVQKKNGEVGEVATANTTPTNLTRK
jgi:hypothetical protein